MLDFQDDEDRIYANGRRYATFDALASHPRDDGIDLVLDLGSRNVLHILDFSRAEFDASELQLVTG